MRQIKAMLTRRYSLVLLLGLIPILSVALAQTGGFNEREAPYQASAEDKDGVWVLNFRFKDPRLITVDIPGRGRRLCWYMWYQVINYTGQPRTFIPDFELVTFDKPGTYHDQVLPKVQEAIKKIEDTTGHLNIKNSVTIAREPIPPSKKDAFPRPVTGVAIWDDVDPEASKYTIFVSGLSNGWSLAEIPPDNQQVIRRKTLQLNFKRTGDKFSTDAREIKFVSPVDWIYRGSLKVPGLGPKMNEPKKEPAEDKAPDK